LLRARRARHQRLRDSPWHYRHGYDRAIKEKYDHLIAAGLTFITRWGQPEDVAKAVVAIAQGSFPFSTGEVINVDGGFHLSRL
jgi:NAD(P)-dependent dehydrogenase (short-subunit alcohol dehydrogenase family)